VSRLIVGQGQTMKSETC